jgi:hypothetical protein
MRNFTNQFNAAEFTVPACITKNSDWQDVSWGNDVAPRWENREIGIAIWVFQNDVEQREYPEGKRYSVVELIHIGRDNAEVGLKDDDIFTTDDEEKLSKFIEYYNIQNHLNGTIHYTNILRTPFPELADELVTALAILDEKIASLVDPT